MFLKIKLVPSLICLKYIIAFIFFYPFCAFAIDPNSTDPIEIESDQATLDDKTGSSTYTGNVIISQGQTRLEADFIIVSSEDRKITSIKATGSPAHFVQLNDSLNTNTHGYGNTISYSTQLESLTFTGEARLLQDENSFSGEVIEYDVVKKAIKAKGDENIGSRVKIQYFPSSSTNK
ncbi:MAG: lipopolysaccharide export system protein LptA [Oleiphilaceae bacterium]|jgi:lipopolysaccharide export system protein LptA